MKSKKGGEFEREVCPQLSLWLSKGKHDDWFWRASQSGGRATQRSKTGRRTIGHYGDIAATCPEAAEFMKFVTIELKRGYGFKKRGSKKPRAVFSTVYDLLDRMDAKSQVIDQFIDQATKAHQAAGSEFWAIIHKRDRREAVIYGPRSMFTALGMIGVGIPHLIFWQPKGCIAVFRFRAFLLHAKFKG